MNERNYARELERIIRNQDKKGNLLLHSCCGPCSSSVLEYLVPHFDVTVLWYNPNLYPEEEFDRRLNTQKELIQKMGLDNIVKIIETEWRSEEYYQAVAGLENEPEGGARCEQCFLLRMRECAKIAKERNFDYFCTTLTVSRYKNTVLINKVGEKSAEETGAVWLPSDFKKHNGEMRSAELAAYYSLYRQKYCGCEFSLKAREGYEECRKGKKIWEQIR